MHAEQLLEAYLDHVAQEARVRPGEPADRVACADPAADRLRRDQQRFDRIGLPRTWGCVA